MQKKLFKAAPVSQVLKKGGICVRETAQRSVEGGNHLRAKVSAGMMTCSCEQHYDKVCTLHKQRMVAEAFSRGGGSRGHGLQSNGR